jgi:hypothetical protein
MTQNPKNEESLQQPMILGAIAIVTVLILFNMMQISQLSVMLNGGHSSSVFSAIVNKATLVGGGADLSSVDLAGIQNTAQAVTAVLPVSGIKDAQDAINKLIPTGTPEYGAQLGVSYDNPVQALQLLQKLYYQLKPDIQKNDPTVWQRYLALATKPVGISCEYCCGVGPVGITKTGELTCGCSHNPAIQALTLWLMKNTKMTDAEVLREDLKWKTLWFPKDMVGMALKIAGGDTSALNAVPGMVGGC